MTDSNSHHENRATLTRRRLLTAVAATGVGGAALHRAAVGLAQDKTAVTPEMVEQAEWIAGVTLDSEQRAAVAGALQDALDDLQTLRAPSIGYDVPPALYFFASPTSRSNSPGAGTVPSQPSQPRAPAPDAASAESRPDSDEELAFLPVRQLATLLRRRVVSSVELTRLYLGRLRKFDPLLKCVVTLTEELALRRAKLADDELAAGRDRGWLHGIPWGAKDLIAYPGYPTTWGAPQFREQQFEEPATVARRLDEAGAVLVAKLSLGALAWGDRWFGGQTRNPWDPREGSSGSSAGSASATAAGLVGFSLGSETLGSIISPSRRCACSALRPTFGRVSRHGCMTLAWSMDKIGPICRSLDDCALVFDIVRGSDRRDPTVVDAPFQWPAEMPKSIRCGYLESEGLIQDRPELQVMKELGATLVAIQLPDSLPVSAMTLVLGIEASTAFEDLVRRDDLEGTVLWPNVLRRARYLPAVDYLRACRLRTLLMRQMENVFEQVDMYVSNRDLAITNLTGHPSVALALWRAPEAPGAPPVLTLTGSLFGESQLLAVANAYQVKTGFHQRHPTLVAD